MAEPALSRYGSDIRHFWGEMASEIPRFANIGDPYINVHHIVAVYAHGKEQTKIETTTDTDRPATVNLPIKEVLNAIATAERPIGLD